MGNLYFWGDSIRDFLVSSKISTFKEFTIYTPLNPLFEIGISNTFFYYLLLKIVISFTQNSFMLARTVSFVFLISATFFYILQIKKSHGNNASILAIVILIGCSSFSELFPSFWQVSFMIGFGLIGIGILISDFRNKIILSTFFLAIGSLIHYQMFVLYIILTAIIYITDNKKIKIINTLILIAVTYVLSTTLNSNPDLLLSFYSTGRTAASFSDYILNLVYTLENILVLLFTNIYLGIFFSVSFLYLITKKYIDKTPMDKKMHLVTNMLSYLYRDIPHTVNYLYLCKNTWFILFSGSLFLTLVIAFFPFRQEYYLYLVIILLIPLFTASFSNVNLKIILAVFLYSLFSISNAFNNTYMFVKNSNYYTDSINLVLKENNKNILIHKVYMFNSKKHAAYYEYHDLSTLVTYFDKNNRNEKIEFTLDKSKVGHINFDNIQLDSKTMVWCINFYEKGINCEENINLSNYKIVHSSEKIITYIEND